MENRHIHGYLLDMHFRLGRLLAHERLNDLDLRVVAGISTEMAELSEDLLQYNYDGNRSELLDRYLKMS